MGKILDPVIREERIAVIKRHLADGLTPHLAAVAMGLNSGSVYSMIRTYGIEYAGTNRMSAESRRRMSRRVRTPMQAREQVGNPADHDPEAIESVVRICQCSPEHAAWVLSCPRGERVEHRCRIGWRNGAAIG